MEDSENRIVDILTESMGRLKSIVDVDTVMGEPVELPDGNIIIPITKVAMGFVAGGGEYTSDRKHLKDEYPFSGGSGAGFSIKPIGFLVSKNGEFELITISDTPAYQKLTNIMADLAKTYIKKKTQSNDEGAQGEQGK